MVLVVLLQTSTSAMLYCTSHPLLTAKTPRVASRSLSALALQRTSTAHSQLSASTHKLRRLFKIPPLLCRSRRRTFDARRSRCSGSLSTADKAHR